MRLFGGRARAGDDDRERYRVIEVIGASDRLDEAVGRAADRIARRRAGARRSSGRAALALLLTAAAAAAAWAGARALLARDAATAPARGPLAAASAALRQALGEAQRAREAAERELRADHLARGGRTPPPEPPDGA